MRCAGSTSSESEFRMGARVQAVSSARTGYVEGHEDGRPIVLWDEDWFALSVDPASIRRIGPGQKSNAVVTSTKDIGKWHNSRSGCA